MTQAYVLERKQVPMHLIRGRMDRSFTVRVCETVSIPADAGTWSGGTRELYSAMRLSDGEKQSITDTFSPPWDADRRNRLITLRPGFAVIETGHFCGRDRGVTFYLHPQDAAPMLPAPAPELSPDAQFVLNCIVGLTSAGRKNEYGRAGYSAARVETAKAELLAAGLITKQGAATVAGQNARVR
jgi:hypothetical protein